MIQKDDWYTNRTAMTQHLRLIMAILVQIDDVFRGHPIDGAVVEHDRLRVVVVAPRVTAGQRGPAVVVGIGGADAVRNVVEFIT